MESVENENFWKASLEKRRLKTKASTIQRIKKYVYNYSALPIIKLFIKLLGLQPEKYTVEKHRQIVTQITNEKQFIFSELTIPTEEFESYIRLYKQKYISSNYTIYIEKLFEHFITTKLFEPNAGNVCVDIGAFDSPYAGILAESTNAKVFSYDLCYSTDLENFKVGGISNKIELPDESVDYAFAHCAIDNFEGSSDIEIMDEIYRILKPGGRFAIIPLHLRTRAENVVSLGTKNIVKDPDVRLYYNPPFYYRFGRHYSLDTFKIRLVKKDQFNTVQIIEVKQDYSTEIYCRFVAIFTK